MEAIVLFKQHNRGTDLHITLSISVVISCDVAYIIGIVLFPVIGLCSVVPNRLARAPTQLNLCLHQGKIG